MGIGFRLKELLRERKMTIKELAEQTGISLNTLYSITKRDSIRVDAVLLAGICKGLNVSVDELIDGPSGQPQSLLSDLQLPNPVLLENSGFLLEYRGGRAVRDLIEVLGYNVTIVPVKTSVSSEDAKAHRKRVSDDAYQFRLIDETEKTDLLFSSTEMQGLVDVVLNFLNFQIAEKKRLSTPCNAAP